MNNLIRHLKNPTEDLFLKRNYHPKYPICLYNYSLESPKFHPAVVESRSTVLDFDYSLITRGFKRFFNLHEKEHSFNWNNFTCYEKVDGTYINLYSVYGQWEITTRQTFGEGKVNDSNYTWKDLFWRNIKLSSEAHRYTSLVFELVGPLNKIVRDYPESLYLLAGWDRYYNVELTDFQLDHLAHKMSVLRPQRYDCNSLDAVMNLLEEKEQSDETFEGFVVKDNLGERIKIKSSTYLSIHSLWNNGSVVNKRSVVKLFLSNDLDEVIEMFPHSKEVVLQYKTTLLNFLHNCEEFYSQIKHIESQKDFALAAKNFSHPSVLFLMRQYNKPACECINENTLLKVLNG